MAKSRGNFVRFKCPRCFTRLKAHLKLIGSRRRCFQCQWVFEVPTEAEAARRAAKVEGYSVSEGMQMLVTELQRHVAAECPVCNTRIDAAEDQVGQQTECPECGTSVRVPPPAEVEVLPEEIGPPAPDEGYALSEEVDDSAAGVRAADQTYLSVTCPVCNTDLRVAEDQVGQEIVCPDCRRPFVVRATGVKPEKPSRVVPGAEAGAYRLYGGIDQPADEPRTVHQTYIAAECPVCYTRQHATEDQVGQKLVCPDCDTSFPILPGPPKPKKTTLRDKAKQPDRYALCEGDSQAADSPVMSQTYIAVECYVCQARLHATEDQVGREIVCPDCGRPVLVRPRPPAKQKFGPRKADHETHRSTASAARPAYEPLVGGRRWRLGFGKTSAAAPVRMAPPRWPLLYGIVRFPFYRDSWGRWLGLSAVAALVLFAVVMAIELGSLAEGEWQFAAAITLGITIVIGMIWTITAAVHCLAILRDTAYGHDQVEGWPDGAFVDWALDSIYVFMALAISVTPGFGLNAALRSTELPPWSLPAASFVVFFPIVLLSMLEANSLGILLSRWVCRSWLGKWWAWGLFYVETAAPAAAVGWLVWEAQISIELEMLPALAPVVVALLMVYFRLLGRLAWCCAGGARQDERRSAKTVLCDDVDRG